MEKILISTDSQKVDDEVSKLENLLSTLAHLNNYLKENLSMVVTNDIAIDVISTGGEKIIKAYTDQQDKKLENAGLSGKIKSNTLKVLVRDLTEELEEIQEQFNVQGSNRFTPLQSLSFVEIKENGSVSKKKDYQQSLVNLYSVFAETPEHIELFNAQKAAVEALNDLRSVTVKVAPSITFISPTWFYATFFEMDAKDTITAKPLNYKLI